MNFPSKTDTHTPPQQHLPSTDHLPVCKSNEGRVRRRGVAPRLTAHGQVYWTFVHVHNTPTETHTSLQLPRHKRLQSEQSHTSHCEPDFRPFPPPLSHSVSGSLSHSSFHTEVETFPSYRLTQRSLSLAFLWTQTCQQAVTETVESLTYPPLM